MTVHLFLWHSALSLEPFFILSITDTTSTSLCPIYQIFCRSLILFEFVNKDSLSCFTHIAILCVQHVIGNIIIVCYYIQISPSPFDETILLNNLVNCITLSEDSVSVIRTRKQSSFLTESLRRGKNHDSHIHNLCISDNTFVTKIYLEREFHWLNTLTILRVWLYRGKSWILDFFKYLYTLPKTTSNYSAMANLHNSQFTTAHAKSFPACCVFTSRSLATASNSGDSLAFRPHVVSSLILVQNCLPAISSGTLNPILCCNCQLPFISFPSLLNYSANCRLRSLYQSYLTANSQLTLSWPGILVT
jgi:hypothetical protein